MEKWLYLAGILCLVYCVGIGIMGHGTNFYLIWGVFGLAFLVLGRLQGKGIFLWRILPGYLKYPAVVLLLFGIVLFVVVEGCIVSRFGAKAPKGLDYLVVLGAQMKENGPSVVLRYRLDEACEYLKENTDTRVIVSGGQGANELVSEAEGMRDYLIQMGIAPERIVLEDASRNTCQNLQYAAAFLDPGQDSVGIVTNNFHMFRALHLAKAAGYRQVHGLAANSTVWMLPQNMLREFCGVTKDFLFGNMS